MRRLCLFTALFVTASCLLAGDLDATETARGVVFEDANGNGRRDRGELGIGGVLISNGREVIPTGRLGEYAIDVEERDIVFITKPTGYTTPLNEYNLPQFYYIHQPTGTPESLRLRYRGIDPTGPLPESIDFALIRSKEPDNFNVIWFSDTQPQTAAEIDFIRDGIISELIGVDAAFGITTGDIMYDDLSLFRRNNAIIAQIGIPWYNVPGNHEMNLLSPDDEHSLETFKRHFGPRYYSFDYGQVHFIVLEDVIYLGTSKYDERPRFRGGGTYEGGLDDEQLEWLANDLAMVPKDKLVVLAMHIPFRSNMEPDRKSVNVGNREEIFRLLEGFSNVCSIAGHMHTTYHNYFGPDDGFRGAKPLHEHVIATVSGSWWSGPKDDRGIPVSYQRDGTPNGYYIMSVRGTEHTMRFRAAGRPEDEQVRIILDTAHHLTSQSSLHNYRPGQLFGSPLHRDRVYATQVVVNLFDGGPRSTVEFTVGSIGPVVMKRIHQKDPFIQDHFMRYDAERKNWVEEDVCQHLWVAPLPAELDPGTHTLTVRAVDEYGQTHRAHKIIEVVTN